MPAPKHIPHYTIADYSQWDGDWELWRGIPVAMTPSPFGRHQWVAGQLLTRLNTQLRAVGCSDCYALGETDWVIAEDTVVRPDIAVVCGEFPDRYITNVPRIVIEVLSQSTEQKDRTVKFELYQAEGVETYILVDPNKRTTEAHRLVAGRYQPYPSTSSIQISLHSDCQIELPTNLDFKS